MFRIGYGWDSHRFKSGIPLKIGGVTLPHDRGLSGHSDGDVLLHAITDALLGGVAAGDIGAYFPSTDKKWKGADSVVFITEALKRVSKAGYAIANVDCTLILSAPRIGPHARQIQSRVAQLLKIAPGSIGIKAKTPEGMGTDNAAIAHVAVLLMKRGASREQTLEAAEAVPQPEVDEVVEQVLQSVAPPKKKGSKVHARR
jgi:2-C-methyl-D-erythritol 2,4-cyclodiphosphate synthase